MRFCPPAAFASLLVLFAAPSAPTAAAPLADVSLEARLIIASPQALQPRFSGERFRKRLDRQPGQPPGGDLKPLPVRVILRLRNTGPDPMEIREGSDASSLELTVTGPGAVSVQPAVAMTREFRLGKPVSIPGGGTHDIVFTTLGSGLRGMGTWHYWTQPGTFEVAGHYQGQLADERLFRLGFPAVRVEVTGR